MDDGTSDIWPVTAERAETGELRLGGVAVIALAERFGTPLYIYDERTLRERASLVRDAFAAAYPRSRVVYAGKAFLNLSLLRILRDEGLGLDVVSGGELYAGLRAGTPPAEIAFHGNNKGEDELREAIAAGVGTIVIDNDHEIELLARLSDGRDAPVTVMLRLNPDIDVDTHQKIATGVADSKFGFPISSGQAERAVAAVLRHPHLDLAGYHAHIGSQLVDVSSYTETVEALIDFAAAMRDRHGVVPREL
nr:diaminopimelate decarboxylase [Chloroflexia bacterium]